MLSKYPQEIVAVAFENVPPVDPPTIFVDLDPSMDPAAQLRFLCDQLWPVVRQVDPGIGVTASYGWWAEDGETGGQPSD